MAATQDSTRSGKPLPAVEEIWRWLETVPDPEIPIVSVVDLGIVRDVAWKGEDLAITITPTYSGCPATAVIGIEIQNALRDRGLERINLKTELSPPWTTAWISESGRSKLKDYGIAPPQDGVCAGAVVAPGSVACPQCGSHNTEEVSRFGSTPCKSSWRCKDCLEPFDYFKSF